MPLSQSIVYGIIQGLTEFLPVSSSAHLILIPFFTGWPDPGLAFDVAMHWGTLIAVILYFRKDVVAMLVLFFESLKGKRSALHAVPWKIAAATVPGAVFGLIFEKHAEGLFRNPLLLAGTLSIMGVALWIADKWGKKVTKLEDISWGKALLIGIGQGIAIVPGISRSGITMTMGLLLGLEREAAVKFSFFLAIPITLGAGLLKSKYIFSNLGDPSISIGIITSGLCGLAAIHILISYVKKNSFTPFVIYRLALAATILLVLGSRS